MFDLAKYRGKYTLMCIVYAKNISSNALRNREYVWEKMCQPGMAIEPDMNQSSLLITNIIPNDNILGVLLLPWFEGFHALALLMMTKLATEKQFLAHQQK